MSELPESSAGRAVHGAHSHLWIVGALGLAGGTGILLHLPRWKAAGQGLLWLAGMHVLAGVVLLVSAAYLRSLSARTATKEGVDFGWTPGWMNGLAVAALLCLGAALVLQNVYPAVWPLAWGLLLLSGAFAVGNMVVGSFRRNDFAVLPLVPFFKRPEDQVLDAGCGAGRTSLAVAAMLPQARISAVDRFDADYIDGGGQALLEQNLRLMGLQDRVQPIKADLTALPFAEANFDSAVSTAVFDHLGRAKAAALTEVYRTLKPGGRFLMLVWVPSWSTFMVGNVFSFLLTGRSAWMRLAEEAGFKVLQQGVHNFSWFLLMEKPVEAVRG